MKTLCQPEKASKQHSSGVKERLSLKENHGTCVQDGPCHPVKKKFSIRRLRKLSDDGCFFCTALAVRVRSLEPAWTNHNGSFAYTKDSFHLWNFAQRLGKKLTDLCYMMFSCSEMIRKKLGSKARRSCVADSHSGTRFYLHCCWVTQPAKTMLSKVACSFCMAVLRDQAWPETAGIKTADVWLRDESALAVR